MGEHPTRKVTHTEYEDGIARQYVPFGEINEEQYGRLDRDIACLKRRCGCEPFKRKVFFGEANTW
jgi:hypothetical protein